MKYTTLPLLAGCALLAGVTSAFAESGDMSWSGTVSGYTVTGGNYIYPNGLSVDHTDSWDLTNHALVTIAGTPVMFLGAAQGGTYTAIETLNVGSSDHTGGTVYLPGNASNGIYIGHQNGTSFDDGVLNINDGVTFQVGKYVASRIVNNPAHKGLININDGSLQIYGANANQLLDVNTYLGSTGSLFVAGLSSSNLISTLTANRATVNLSSGLNSSIYSLLYEDVSLTSIASGATAVSGVRVSVIPEPSTYAMIGAGLALGVAFVARRRKAK